MAWRWTIKISELREYAKENGWTEDEYGWGFEKTAERIFHAKINVERFDNRWVVTGELSKQYPRLECYEHAKNCEFSFQPIIPTRAEGFSIMLDAMQFFDAMVTLFNHVSVWVGTSPAWFPQSPGEKTQ